MAFRLQINSSYDLPFLSGYSKDGRTIYLDRDLPSHIQVKGQQLDVRPFLIAHEHLEKALIEVVHCDYETAHEFATVAEHERLRAAGLSPVAYERAIAAYLKPEIRQLRALPPDLDLTPYKREQDRAMLLHLRKANGADVFISYSKSDRVQTEQLARTLESKDFTVWWDTDLVPGDSYKDVIVGELARARAVIVVWTPASVRSDWVYSEARRASERRVLIPVRGGGITINDIPPPFDSLHTEPLSNLAAIEAGLAKLGVRVRQC